MKRLLVLPLLMAAAWLVVWLGRLDAPGPGPVRLDVPEPLFKQPGNVTKVFSALESAPAVTLVSLEPIGRVAACRAFFCCP